MLHHRIRGLFITTSRFNLNGQSASVINITSMPDTEATHFNLGTVATSRLRVPAVLPLTIYLYPGVSFCRAPMNEAEIKRMLYTLSHEMADLAKLLCAGELTRHANGIRSVTSTYQTPPTPSTANLKNAPRY